MKAVILAGGEGTRLRPLTCTVPKPMIPLLGKPVMEHMLRHLAEQGIRDVAVTLCYLPEAIRSYFGDGHDFGVDITYFTETAPLGTAGCIAACSDFVDDTTLILSGDGVCDFDFSSALEKHEKTGAEATVLLTSCLKPLEYGLVVTDGDGKILRFCEKPSWPSVCTDMANTGIYIIEPELLKRIAGKSDFARDIFPQMLKENAPLYGFEAEGYWCDIGDAAAYLDCMRAMLDKCQKLRNAAAAQPVYMEPGAVLETAAQAGPYVYLGRNAVVEGGASVINSSVEGHIGANARVSGAIIAKNARIGAGSVIESGAVIGENAVIGRGVTVKSGVRIWPGRVCPDGCTVRYSLTGSSSEEQITVTDGLISAPSGVITPELCLSLGTAAAKLGSRVGISCEPGSFAALYLSAFGTGVCAGGSDTVDFSADFPAEAAYAAVRVKLDPAVFMEYKDGLSIYVFSGLGLPYDGGKLRKLLSDAQRGSFDRAADSNCGRRTRIMSLSEDYCRAADYGSLHGSRFSVSMTGPGKTLCNILWLRGARILPTGSGCPVFAVTDGGFGLEACDEEGECLSDMKTLACAVYIMAHRGQVPAVPFAAPAAFSLITSDAGVHLKRAGEDNGGTELWAKLPQLRDGIRRAVYIAAYLRSTGMTLHELSGKLPAFAESGRTMDLSSSRPEFMRAAAALLSPCSFGEGIRAGYGGGRVVIIPCADRSAVRVLVESYSQEAAEELCGGLCERLQGLDSAVKRRKKPDL